jgi:hypothetical protein
MIIRLFVMPVKHDTLQLRHMIQQSHARLLFFACINMCRCDEIAELKLDDALKLRSLDLST